MATRNSSGVERRRVRVDGNRPRTHPKRPGRKTTKLRPAPADSCDCPDPGPLLRLSRAIALVETIAVATQTHEDDIKRGSIAMSLELACCQLWRAHGAVNLALDGATT
jgi:hypothetical protein